MKNYHPIIETLEEVKIDVTHSREVRSVYVGWSATYRVVPNELAINGDRDIWKNCPSLVNWDVLKCIEELEALGQYPYNQTVGDKFLSLYAPGMKYSEGTLFSAVVYGTQCYKSALQYEQAAKERHERLTAAGFTKLDTATIGAINTKKRYLLDGINGKRIEVRPAVGNNGETYWIPKGNRSNGYRIGAGQYIKPV